MHNRASDQLLIPWLSLGRFCYFCYVQDDPSPCCQISEKLCAPDRPSLLLFSLCSLNGVVPKSFVQKLSGAAAVPPQASSIRPLPYRNRAVLESQVQFSL